MDWMVWQFDWETLLHVNYDDSKELSNPMTIEKKEQYTLSVVPKRLENPTAWLIWMEL